MGRRGLRGQQSEVSTLQELLGVKGQKLGEEGSEGPAEWSQCLSTLRKQRHKGKQSEGEQSWNATVVIGEDYNTFIVSTTLHSYLSQNLGSLIGMYIRPIRFFSMLWVWSSSVLTTLYKGHCAHTDVDSLYGTLVSLSKLHINRAALCKCMCMFIWLLGCLFAWIDHYFLNEHTFKHFTIIEGLTCASAQPRVTVKSYSLLDSIISVK